MKLTQEIYNQYKKIADFAYMQMYGDIITELPDDIGDEDEQEALTVDIMLSNILGYITSFDEVHEYIKNKEMYENLAHENKCMAEALQRLNYTPEQISDICNGAI